LSKNLSKKEIFNYSFLALPLAFIGLPIYVNISDFYAREFGLALGVISFILLFARFFDLIQDPIIGYFSDLLVRKNFSRKKIIFLNSIFLSLSFLLLFSPPKNHSEIFYIFWFLIFLSFTYLFFNFILINFESSAVIIAKNKDDRISINSLKEFFGLIGILLASALPSFLLFIFDLGQKNSYFILGLTFAILLLSILFFFFRKVEILEKTFDEKLNFLTNIKEIFSDKIYRKFLFIFLINSIAVSIPASVVTFFVADILKLDQKFLGIFLVIYFLSGAIFIFFWKNLSNKFGKIRTWIISIIGSIITFSFAFFITSETANYFYLISFLAGAFLGADLIMPPAIIADLIHDKNNKISSYLSFWSMITKFGLLIASFSSLFILDYYGYQPGNYLNNSLNILSFIYAICPVILKILVIFFLLTFLNNYKNYEK
jgi:Na+/melibiose symporter-like transporter